MPDVSIIIPVYNIKTLLPRCVASLQAQTWQDFEVWLVDDGSTDGSGPLCDELAVKDARIHVLHKENGGQGLARDLGLDPEKVNIYGGGISIGHPIGATGTILAIKCAYELAQRHPEKQDAMVSMCIGGGQGISMYFTKE